MKTVKESATNGNGNHSTNGDVKEFDFGEENDNKTVRAMIKAVTMTRKRLYPERYDSKGKLKAEYAKKPTII